MSRKMRHTKKDKFLSKRELARKYRTRIADKTPLEKMAFGNFRVKKPLPDVIEVGSNRAASKEYRKFFDREDIASRLYELNSWARKDRIKISKMLRRKFGMFFNEKTGDATFEGNIAVGNTEQVAEEVKVENEMPTLQQEH